MVRDVPVWSERCKDAGELRGGSGVWDADAHDAGPAGLIVYEHRGESHHLRVSGVLPGDGAGLQRDTVGLRGRGQGNEGIRGKKQRAEYFLLPAEVRYSVQARSLTHRGRMSLTLCCLV